MELPIVCPPTRRDILKLTAGLLLLPAAASWPFPVHANQIQFENRYSPLNKKRPRRPNTRYIVLHTTEGDEEGSLRKIVRFGEAHYCVGISGEVYRIIDKGKIAKHAGRSMWEGRSSIDKYSIGIEVVGYHNRDINEAQYAALRELLRQLKGVCHISDEDVLTHSMVAYGRPNRFHNDNHRGRKRCGMIFARPDVRVRLGLESKPTYDADVKAGRLRVGDRELYSFLFAAKPKPTLVAYLSLSRLPRLRLHRNPPSLAPIGRRGISRVSATTIPRPFMFFPTAGEWAAIKFKTGREFRREPAYSLVKWTIRSRLKAFSKSERMETLLRRLPGPAMRKPRPSTFSPMG
jgi:hypothetical protein